MPNLRLSLTDAICKRARPEGTEYALHDNRQPGLSLRVQTCGARSWIIRIRVNGKQVKRSLGSFPDTGVNAARRLANALLAGDAPTPEPSLTTPLFEVFQSEHEAKHGRLFKASGLRAYRSYVYNQLLPAFAGKRLDAITRPDVAGWFEHYSLRRPGGANRALGILSQMLDCAKHWGHLPPDWINPAIGVRHNRRKPVGTFLSEEQMSRLGNVLTARAGNLCMAASLLRFLTMTGCRVGEAINLEWRDVLNDRLRLRDSKTGPRDVALGAPVRQFLKGHRVAARRHLLASLPPSALNNDAVFPLPLGQEYEQVRTAWRGIRKDANLPDSLRIHDLRHSFASHAVMSGETLLTASRLMGHRRVQTTARYAHLADSTLLQSAEKIGAIIIGAANRYSIG
jgi:integrase